MNNKIGIDNELPLDVTLPIDRLPILACISANISCGKQGQTIKKMTSLKNLFISPSFNTQVTLHEPQFPSGTSQNTQQLGRNL